MKKIIAWTSLFLFTFLIALIVTLPAKQVYHYASQQQTLPVSLHNIQGSVWHGSAAIVLAKGTHIERLEWDIHPLALFGGKIAADLNVDAFGGHGDIDLNSSFKGDVTINSIDYRLKPDSPQIKALVPFDLGGVIELNLQNVLIANGKVRAAAGTGIWKSATIAIDKPVILGDLTADLTIIDGKLEVKLGDKGGPLALSGNVSSTRPMHGVFNASLQARASASPDLRTTLPLLGQSRGGKVQIRKNIKLPL